MLQTEYIELLDRLRFGTKASERNQALNDLKILEMEGNYQAEDLLKLLDEKDFVFQTYAIGAIGRLKLAKGIPRLIRLYRDSNDPLILPVLLSTFLGFGKADFVDCVVEKIETLLARKESNPTGGYAFLLEQIIVPSLKYLQTAGDSRVERIARQFLTDPDPTVRWHALVTYDKLALPLADQILIQMTQQDKYALVREQAAVMLEKRKRIEKR